MSNASNQPSGIKEGIHLGSFVVSDRALTANASSYQADKLCMSIQIWSEFGPYCRLTHYYTPDYLKKPGPWQVIVNTRDYHRTTSEGILKSALMSEYKAIDADSTLASLNVSNIPIASIAQISKAMGWPVSENDWQKAIIYSALQEGLHIDQETAHEVLVQFQADDFADENLRGKEFTALVESCMATKRQELTAQRG